jgi:hypothetical protein
MVRFNFVDVRNDDVGAKASHPERDPLTDAGGAARNERYTVREKNALRRHAQVFQQTRLKKCTVLAAEGSFTIILPSS